MSMGAGKPMKRNNARTITYVLSMATLRPSVHLPLYSTVRSALDGTTKLYVLEFGSDGIRVNAGLPSLFATSLADVFTPEQILKATQKTSLERLWPPKIGHAVLFLASTQLDMSPAPHS